MAKKLNAADIESRAIEIVRKERSSWETATAFITDKVAFNMRNLIRQLRKNYWGVFDQPNDPITGKKKTWVPLTESMVESVVKNIDLDTKDINFRAKNPSAIGLTRCVRSIVKNYLDRMDFGEHLDMFERNLAIDGTAVWKTLERKDEETGKVELQILPVDLLNIYIDPTAPSIKEAYRFTERSLMTAEEIKQMKDWMNTDQVFGKEGVPRVDSMLWGAGTQSFSSNKYVDVWEMWGKVPKSLITGQKDDEQTDVEARIVISGLETGNANLHLLEQNPGVRPYEEAWYTRINGRWYGKGIAEKLMMLQLWMNTTVNLRINRAYIAQLGIFKIKKGSGITPQILQKLVSNGAITVNSQDDIEQLEVQEAGPTSYQDEQSAYDWSQKNTGAFEIVQGDNNPASTSATANAIQNTNAQSQFTLIKEGVGMFLQRWMKRQALPIILKRTTMGEVIRAVGDPDEIRSLDELMVNQLLAKHLTEMNQYAAAGLPAFVNPDQIHQERQNALLKLQQMGEDRYIKLLHNMDPTEYDTEVFVTNEEIDKGVLSQNLLTLAQIAPQYQEEIVQDLMDIMGLPFFPKASQQQPMQPGQPGQPGQPQQPGLPQVPTQKPQQVIQQANTVNAP